MARDKHKHEVGLTNGLTEHRRSVLTGMIVLLLLPWVFGRACGVN